MARPRAAFAEEQRMSAPTVSPKRKVAVLGGGAGSMAALWALTSLPGAAERYDITVYQMGWRLGGKGASGRNAAFGHRIEEHGLHVWAGFYRNAFRMMREIYAAQPSDGRLFTQWSDAFKRHSHVLLEEHVNGDWIGWAIDLPEDPHNDPAADPTTGGELPAPGEYLRLIIDAMINRAEQVKWDLESEIESHAAVTAGGWLARTEQVLDHGELAAIAPALLAAGIFTDRAVVSVERHAAKPLLRVAHDLAAALPADPSLHSRAHLALIGFFVRDGVAAAHAVLGLHAADHEARRLDDLLSLAGATVVGLIDDDVLKQGFEAINDVDWTVWMGRHGARSEALASAMVRGIYDYVFGYERGRGDRRALEAGTAVNGILRLFFTYKGSLFWEMQAGMGDVVFAPTYEVLRSRGVKFRFFHAVESLDADTAGTAVQQIRIRRQARVKSDAEYAPLERINGVPSWPSAPDLSQLVNGDTLKDAAFESAWAPPTGDLVTLMRSVDFDDVILGISIGGVKDVCRGLGAPDSAFQRMLGTVQTVQTCSMQIWLTADAAAAGVPQPPPIASCYVDNLNTWSDMTFLLPRETWPAGGPQCILYLCGQFPDADVIPPYSDHDFPARERARLRADAVAWLNANAAVIWARMGLPGGGFDWSRLFDASGAGGEARLDAQYLRVNIDPSERYVLSLPGTSKFRLRAGESGFVNLFLTGDWVRTSINAGCVEAAVMAGMDAASALSGQAIPVVGGLK
jgi:uncharacterized protein with NAD-binding domain and iron-sulfur cluster